MFFVGVTECFPHTTALENLIAAESHHLTKFRVCPSASVTLRPIRRTFADNPVTLADSLTSFGNQEFLSFFHDN